MDKSRNSPRPRRTGLELQDHPPPMDTGTSNSGGVPVRRTPPALARRFFQICTTATAEMLAGENLTNLQYGGLVYLSRVGGEPDIDQNGLAGRLGIDRASTSQLVDELEEMGLVERRVNGADRRARLLRLTPRGERLRARLSPALSARQMRVLAALTPHERELLLDLLVRVVESNRTLARPGAGRRKRGSHHSTASKSRQSPSNKT
jgi:DNA-binding MarR family transcriptional regulator